MAFAQRITEGISSWLRVGGSPGPGSGARLRDLRCVVSDEYRFVYVVTPKVACTSVKTALLPLFGRDPAEAGDRGHAHGILAREGAVVTGEQFVRGLESRYRGYFKFAFVRNPYDRLVSCYYSKINPRMVGMDHEPRDGAELRPGMSFEEFAGAVCRIPDRRADVHFRSQHLAVRGPGRDDGLPVDFLGRFEDLERDFGRVSEALGVPLDLPHSNRSERRERRDYRGLFGPELAAAVGTRYRTDCEAFGYTL